MDFPADLFVAPVPGHDDLVKFQYDFVLEGKAVGDSEAQTVTVEENGDLIIEGYAAVFDGVDRQGENFAEGAFQRGIKAFLEGQAGLCYHHKHDKLLGKVLDLQEEEGKGLKMKARVDAAIKNHPELGVYYEQIRRGTLNALSVGGFFRRKLTELGQKIVDMDFTEISVTPVPVHPGTNFAVVAGKALASDIKVPDEPNVDEDTEIREDDLRTINYLFEELDGFFRRIEESVSKRKQANTNQAV